MDIMEGFKNEKCFYQLQSIQIDNTYNCGWNGIGGEQ